MPKHDDDVEIPSMMLDQDEVKPRREAVPPPQPKPTPSEATEPYQSGATAPHQPEAMPTPIVHAVVEKPSLIGIYILLGISLCVVSVFGYIGWSQNQQLKAELERQIQDLDSQLIAADASAAEQGLTIEETLKKHNSEIRKLWGVSYDTNRKAIKKNTQGVSDLEKSQSSIQKSQTSLDKKISEQGKKQTSLEKSQKSLADVNKITKSDLEALKKQQVSMVSNAKTLSETVKKQNTQIERLMKSLAELETQNTNSEAKLKAAEKTLKEVNTSVASMERKLKSQLGDSRPGDLEIQLKDHQEAIESIDAYRIQVNNKLNRLETHINQLLLQSQLE